LSVTTSWPDLAPIAVGVNVTLIVQECPAATEFPQLFVCAKSPSVVMLNNVKAVLRWLGGVEVWRGGVGEAYPLADPFVGRCLTSLAVPLIPHPAHRTGRAERPHPALGERLTVTPTENCSSVW